MHIDVEIDVTPLQVCQGDGPFPRLPTGYVIEERGTRIKGYYLRGPTSEGNNLLNSVSSFLNGLASIQEFMFASGLVMRLGVFYDSNETAIYPLRLSSECVQKIAALGLSIDATMYVCHEEEDVDDQGSESKGSDSNISDAKSSDQH